MKHPILVLTGSLFACVSFVYAEEASEIVNIEQQAPEVQVSTESEISQELSNPEIAVDAEAPSQSAQIENTQEVVNVDVASAQVAAPAAQKQVKSQNKSIWDKFLNMFKASEPKTRTCEEAFNKMSGISINFSNTSDFAENGDKYMDLYYQKIKETNSFGTHSSNLYIDLSNLNVSSEVFLTFIGKWSKIFSEDKKTVLWNLSNNKSLGDDVIDCIDLSNMYSLNLANTAITDLTVNKIISILNIQNTGKLVCVNLSGTKVSDAAIKSLKEAFQKAKTDFEAKNPGKTYSLDGDNNSGIIFNKLPEFLKQQPKARKLKSQSSTATLLSKETPMVNQPIIEQTPVAENNVQEEISIAENNPEINSGTSVADISIPAVSESATTVVNDDQINEVLNEADKLIENAEQTVNTTAITPEVANETTDISTENEAIVTDDNIVIPEESNIINSAETEVVSDA